MDNSIQSHAKHCIIVLFFAGILTSNAHASLVTWTIQNAVWDDGGTLTGSFVYDADTNTYSSISITTTSGSAFGGNSYSDAGLSSSIDTVLDVETLNWNNAAGESNIVLIFNDGFGGGLTNAGGTVPFEVGGFTLESYCIDAACTGATRDSRFLDSGSVVGVAVVPIPAAIWLFGSGLLGMTGIARYRKA